MLSKSRLLLPSLLVIASLGLTGCGAGDGSGADSDSKVTVEGQADPRSSQSGGDTEVASATSDEVEAQLDYALAHWSEYNDAEYGVVTSNDCVNFTSQTLLARGWTQTDDWHHGGTSVWDSSSSWVSSTAFGEYLAGHPELATELDDTERDQVALGDVVQFDWDGSGDRDHTGVVTRIEYTSEGTAIYFAGHTEDSDYRSVDVAITEDHPGATVYYWHLQD